MSLPLDEPAGPDVPYRHEEQAQPSSFTLNVLSPSTGVPSPLTFPYLPVTTTVEQLKSKIRDAVSSKPANDGQRLIHRGRLLGTETETMLDIFGQETLQLPEPQTLHLVLRPTSTDPSSAHSSTSSVAPQRVTTPIPRTRQSPPVRTFFVPPQAPNHGDFPQTVLAQLQALQRETARLQHEMGNLEQRALERSRRLGAANPDNPPHPPTLDRFAQAQVPTGGMNLLQPQPVGFRTTQPLPESFQNLMHQRQHGRAADGRNGAQGSPSGANPTGMPLAASSGRASPNISRPDHTSTYTREGVGPNGERWHMTINQTTSTFSIPQNHPHHSSTYQMQGGMPSVDGIQGTVRDPYRYSTGEGVQTPQNSQADASGATYPTSSTVAAGLAPQTQHVGGLPPHIHARVPAQAAVSLLAPIVSNPVHGIAIPPQNANPGINMMNNASNGVEPMVYILSSPHGPRALLLNNSDTFYTLRERSRHQSTRPRNDSPAPAVRDQQGAAPVPLEAFRERMVREREVLNRENRDFNDRPAQLLGQLDNARRHENDPLEPVVAAHANPEAGALGARVGPLVWLIVRLVGFVWFFAGGNNSWSRFLLLSALAVVVFLANTGLFNGAVEQIWGPIRRHVEALIPLAGPEAALVPAANAAAVPLPAGPAPRREQRGVRRRHGELDEAEVAARLIEQQRQANRGWLLTQVRRAEHATLLFLASLVPGVGERHIAAREAEANAAEAERQRQVEAAAAAASAEVANPEAQPQQSEGGDNGISDNPPPHTDGADGPPAPPAVVA